MPPRAAWPLAALDRVGLSARADAIAGGLTTRELRLMELARALAPQPRLMLLDETLAGLGHDDLDGILGVIRQLRADGITVLDHRAHDAGDGSARRPFHRARPRPADRQRANRMTVVRDPSVIEAYLGKKWVEQVTASGEITSG